MKKLTLLLIVGLCLAVSGLAQKKETKRKKPPPPIVKEAEANAKNDKEGNQPPVPGKATGQRAKKRGAPNQNRPPRTTRSSFTANTASVTANDGTTRSAQPKKKSGNDLLRPNKRNRSHTNAKGKKYFLNVDANAENQEADALGTDTVERRIEEDKRKARGRGAEKAQPKRRVRNARQQTRSTTPKRNATKRSNNITLPQTGAVNRRKSQPSTGLDDESDMTWEALDTIDTKLDELTTKIADTILRSADDPVLKRQSQIQQRRILEIKELLKSLKEDSAFIKLGD